MFTGGALMFVMSILRVLVVRLPETPKFLVTSGREEELVSMLRDLASKHGRTCSLTVAQLHACGSVSGSEEGVTLQSKGRHIGKRLLGHLKGLFSTRKLALSTCLTWLSWALIGLGYPLFFLYLPWVHPGIESHTVEPANQPFNPC